MSRTTFIFMGGECEVLTGDQQGGLIFRSSL